MHFTRNPISLLLAPLACLLLPSCVDTVGQPSTQPPPSAGNDGLYDPGYGPFNEGGDYLEHEADAPAYQRRQPSVIGSATPPSGYPTSNPPVYTAPKAPVYSAPVASTPPTPRPTPTYRSHTVKKGENLYRISLRYGTTVSAIQRANGITGTTIHPGQSLRIP